MQLKFVVIIVFISAVTTGCIGGALVADAVNDQKIATGKPYSEFVKTLPAIDSGNGRIFVYFLNTNKVMVGGLMSIDEDAYLLFDGIFFYKDVKHGAHTFTINDMNGLFGMPRYGSSISEVSVQDGESVYVRASIADSHGILVRYDFKLEVIEPQIALAEIADVTYKKDDPYNLGPRAR